MEAAEDFFWRLAKAVSSQTAFSGGDVGQSLCWFKRIPIDVIHSSFFPTVLMSIG